MSRVQTAIQIVTENNKRTATQRTTSVWVGCEEQILASGTNMIGGTTKWLQKIETSKNYRSADGSLHENTTQSLAKLSTPVWIFYSIFK